MTDTETSTKPSADLDVRRSYVPIREGHPRFNLLLLLLLLLAFLVFALIQAQRLQL